MYKDNVIKNFIPNHSIASEDAEHNGLILIETFLSLKVKGSIIKKTVEWCSAFTYPPCLYERQGGYGIDILILRKYTR